MNADALTLWVGYDEDGEVAVDIVYPLDANASTSAEEGLSDYDLQTIEQLALESSNLLDGRVYDFAAAIRSFLQSFEDHSSFADPLMAAWESAKTKLDAESAKYKLYAAHCLLPIPTFSNLAL